MFGFGSPLPRDQYVYADMKSRESPFTPSTFAQGTQRVLKQTYLEDAQLCKRNMG